MGSDTPTRAATPGARAPLSGRLWIVGAALMWSFGGLLIKVLTRRFGVAPVSIAFLRSAAAGLALAWALPRLAGVPKCRVACAGGAYAVLVGCFVAAVAGTTAANAIFLQYTYPLLVALGAWLVYRDPVGTRTLAALALCITGVVIIVTGSWQPDHLGGLGYGLTSAFAFAAFTLLQRGITAGSPVALSSLYNLITAVLLLPLAFNKLDVSVGALVVVACMGVFQLGIPYVMFIRGLRSTHATEAVLITLLEPVLQPIWVWLVVAEVPNRWTVIGAALITAALVARFSALPRLGGKGEK